MLIFTKFRSLIISISALLLLSLSACASPTNTSLVNVKGALTQGAESVQIEDCWRKSLLEQSIKYPALRSSNVSPNVKLDKDFQLSYEGLEDKVPQYLMTAGLAECLASLGSGAVSIGDVNNDGFVDVIGSEGHTWLNDGVDSFVYASTPYKNLVVEGVFNSQNFVNPVIVGTTNPSAVVVDLNNDGINEIIVPNVNRATQQVLLFFNYVNGKWVDVTKNFTIETPKAYTYISAIKIMDYDRDGFLDIVLGHNILFPQFDILNTTPETYQGGVTILKNIKGEGFVNTTSSLGITEVVEKLNLVTLMSDGSEQFFPKTFVLDFGIADLDNDSWLDIVVLGDFGTSFILWNDNGDKFASDESSILNTTSAMGVAFYDINKDGFLDFFITQIYDKNRIMASCVKGRPCATSGNKVMISQGPRDYIDFGEESGMFDGSWAWGVVFDDLDNNGSSEVIQVSGQLVAQPGGLWQFRKGKNSIFVQEQESNGLNAGFWEDKALEFGLDSNEPLSSVASYDFFNKGSSDIVLGPKKYNSLIYYKNNIQNKGNWVTVNPVGNPHKEGIYKSSLQAFGAKVEVESADKLWWLYAGNQNSSYLSSGTSLTRFGVGDAELVNITVTFPSGEVTKLQNIPVNQVVDVFE